MTAYELVKFANESIGFFWNESYSNVHRTLNLLAEENLIEKLPEKGSRNKNIYAINDRGGRRCQWLSNHQHTTIYRDELLLKLLSAAERLSGFSSTSKTFLRNCRCKDRCMQDCRSFIVEGGQSLIRPRVGVWNRAKRGDDRVA